VRQADAAQAVVGRVLLGGLPGQGMAEATGGEGMTEDVSEPADTAIVPQADDSEPQRLGDTKRSTFRRPWWQEPPSGTPRSEQIRRILAEAKAECAARRARVMKYPDLVAALRRPPLSMRPECWNGWVPPELDGYGARNNSLVRAALVMIDDIAREREKARAMA
jgi:hypothetical protein